jgi:hypothetical protein
VVQQDGTPFSGFPISLVSDTGAICPSPAVGNFDADPDLEIVAIATHTEVLADLYVIDTDTTGGTSGMPLAGWPVPVPGNSDGSPVVADINGDGWVDIVHGIGGGSTESPNHLYAFDRHGDLIDGFPILLGGPLKPSSVICDLDDDGDVDIVYGGWDLLIHVWDLPSPYDATLAPWPTFRGRAMRDGVYIPSELLEVPTAPVATELRLQPPYPNPFNPVIKLRLYLPGTASSHQPLQVRVYDLQGRRVRTLHDGVAVVGWHDFVWDGRNEAGRAQASGLYFLQARSHGQVVSRKISLIK